MNKTKEKENDKEEKKPIIVRNTTDLQRLKLEKLMKNPVIIKIHIKSSLSCFCWF